MKRVDKISINIDRTFCGLECPNLLCGRNQAYIPKNVPVSMAYFEDCDYWRDKVNKNDDDKE